MNNKLVSMMEKVRISTLLYDTLCTELLLRPDAQGTALAHGLREHKDLFIRLAPCIYKFGPSITREHILSLAIKQQGNRLRDNHIYKLWKNSFLTKFAIPQGSFPETYMEHLLGRMIKAGYSEVPSIFLESIRYGYFRSNLLHSCRFMGRAVTLMTELGGIHFYRFAREVTTYRIFPRYVGPIQAALKEAAARI